MKWSKKWAAGEKREAGDGARREGAGGGSRAGQEARGPRRAWAARRQQPKSEQRGRFQPRQAPAWGGMKSGKEQFEGPREPRRGRCGGNSGPTPNRAPLLNYL